MSQTISAGSRIQASTSGSRPRPALGSRRVAGARRSVLRRGAEGSGHENQPGLPRPVTNEKTEQINDIAEPKVDQSKTQNIAAGNISNENAERRADIGATRPPTLFGKALYTQGCSHPGLVRKLSGSLRLSWLWLCRGTVFRRTCARDHQRPLGHAWYHISPCCRICDRCWPQGAVAESSSPHSVQLCHHCHCLIHSNLEGFHQVNCSHGWLTDQAYI